MAIPTLAGLGLEAYDYLQTQDTARESAQEAQQAAQAGIGTTQQYLDPFAAAGRTGTQGYLELLQDPSKVTQDPGYQFQLQEGQKALERSAAAKGSLLSGQTLVDITKYGQDYASTAYDQALRRNLALIQPGLQASEAAATGVRAGQEAIGQAAIDREALQMMNRRQTTEGMIGVLEALGTGGAVTAGGPGVSPPSTTPTTGDVVGGIVDRAREEGGIPVIGDWSLSDIYQETQDIGGNFWDAMGDFAGWMQDPNTSLFDPSTWDLPSFEDVVDYTIDDFFRDVGFL